MKSSISPHHAALCAALSLSLLGCSHVRSEPGAPPPPAAPARAVAPAPQPADAVLQYRADLGLSDKQATQIRDAYDQAQGARKPLLGDKSLTPADRAAKLKGIAQTLDTSIEAALTPDQQAKLKALRLKTAASFQAQGRVQMISGPVGLTDDQKAKLKPILRDAFLRMNDVRSDTTLDAKAKGEKLCEIQKQMDADVAAVLTPDQQQKLKAYQEEGFVKIQTRVLLNWVNGVTALTPDQKPKVQTILEEMVRKTDAANADTTLSVPDRNKKIAGIRTDAYTAIDALLTDAQKAGFEKAVGIGKK